MAGLLPGLLLGFTLSCTITLAGAGLLMVQGYFSDEVMEQAGPVAVGALMGLGLANLNAAIQFLH
ncbi:MAG: hypothetical protein H7Y22_14745 [Gemmatimonadaceae bacterium]|nr:hypothetical protein [Gloeobacterales cyanobacterium ES-bin-141]